MGGFKSLEKAGKKAVTQTVKATNKAGKQISSEGKKVIKGAKKLLDHLTGHKKSNKHVESLFTKNKKKPQEKKDFDQKDLKTASSNLDLIKKEVISIGKQKDTKQEDVKEALAQVTSYEKIIGDCLNNKETKVNCLNTIQEINELVDIIKCSGEASNEL